MNSPPPVGHMYVHVHAMHSPGYSVHAYSKLYAHTTAYTHTSIYVLSMHTLSYVHSMHIPMHLCTLCSHRGVYSAHIITIVHVYAHMNALRRHKYESSMYMHADFDKMLVSWCTCTSNWSLLCRYMCFN